jgi:hypothetical protein
MIVARLPATPAEKREVSAPLSHKLDRRGSTNSSNSDSSSGGFSSAPYVSKGVSKDRIRMSLLFVQHGADVNVKDARGRTALMYASMNGLIELSYFLLNQGADYMMQEVSGNNSIMFSLQFPPLVKMFLDFMDENGRPESYFWRQRTLDGKSIFDLAKEMATNNSLSGSHKSLQLLTQFITNFSHYTAYKPPAPLPDQLIQHQKSPRRKSHQNTHSTGSYSPTGHSNLGLSPTCRHNELLPPTTDTELYDYGDATSHLDSSMKRSRSLREFWEKETIDWFSPTHSSAGLNDDDIPSVINPQTRRSSKQGLLIPFEGESSTDTGVIAGGENMIKLPPIPSPLIRHEEWRERGHSLNRRTSVNMLRTVNPIH